MSGATTQWRDAEAERPDDEDAVLIYTTLGVVWVGFLDGEEWRNVGGEAMEPDEVVTHWAPFPQPPEGAK